MAELIKANGTRTPILPKDGGARFTLEELQHLVGGYITFADANIKGYVLVCDEEGLIKNKPINRVAMRYLHAKYSYLSTLVGDIVLIPKKERPL